MRDGIPDWAEGFRSARTRAIVAIVAIVMDVPATLYLTSASATEFVIVPTVGGGAVTAVSAAIALYWVVVSLAAPVAFLAWLSRTVAITPVLGGGWPRVSPRWSIALWFVPVANVVESYRILSDLDGRLGDGRPARGLLVAWALCWWGRAFVSGAVEMMGTDRFGQIVISMLDQVVYAAAAGLVIVIILRIQSNADRRARRLGLEAR